MCGKSILRRQNAGFQRAECVTKSGWTRPRDGAVSSGERESFRAPLWPPNSPTAGFASRQQAKSGGWLQFPRDGTGPTMRPSSSGAAWRSRLCAGLRDRAPGWRRGPELHPRQGTVESVQLNDCCQLPATSCRPPASLRRDVTVADQSTINCLCHHATEWRPESLQLLAGGL